MFLDRRERGQQVKSLLYGQKINPETYAKGVRTRERYAESKLS